MNSRSIEYVVTLFETGSLQSTALRCNATVGTISAQISRLEDYLGLRLFERRSAPARPTAAGYALIVPMQQVVRQLRQIRATAQQLSHRAGPP